MKDLLTAGLIVLGIMGIWLAIPIFAVIAGPGLAILFFYYIIKASKEDDGTEQ
jgi:hypothetical protein